MTNKKKMLSSYLNLWFSISYQVVKLEFYNFTLSIDNIFDSH